MSSALNGVEFQKPHFAKSKRFVKGFAHKLSDNEHQYKFPMKLNGKKVTYNPDYFCSALQCYIECATSRPNISEQRNKWQEAMKQGLALRIYWWEGEEITELVKKGKI